MSTETFYSDLPISENFVDITNCKKFYPAPQDWYIIITDIIGSTKAIENGRYKEINLIGVCSIAAILDIAEDIEIPFIFGGDGATLLIPPSLLTPAKKALLATQKLAKQKFNLDLRIGFVPIATVTQANYQVKVGKIKVLGKYNQGVFAGGGINYATNLVKNPETSHIYNLENTEITSEIIDFPRVACPWQDIRSQHGEIVSLIVTATAASEKEEYQIYKEVLQQIQIIYGKENNYHPVAAQNLKLTFNPDKLAVNIKIQQSLNNWFVDKLYLLAMEIGIFFGWLWMEFHIKLGTFAWEDSKQDFIEATDYRKFSDTLNMVISGNPAQREQLSRYLEKKYREGKLIYGLHISDRALMTCYTKDPKNHHVHFVDGADGGYALAAKAMKAKLKTLPKSTN